MIHIENNKILGTLDVKKFIHLQTFFNKKYFHFISGNIFRIFLETSVFDLSHFSNA